MITAPQRTRLANYLYGGDNTQVGTIVPTTLYIGLMTSNMTDAGVITNEVSGNGYARIAVTNDKDNFSVSTDGTVHNVVDLSFPQSTASWGTIKTVFFAPTATATEALYYVLVDKAVPAQSTLYFAGNGGSGDINLSVVNA